MGIDEIRSKNYALTPSKYIEFIDHDLEIDYKKEMSRILKEQKEAQKMLENAFKGIGYEI